MGAMDTPQAKEGGETLQLALNSGINFIDTAREYQDSEHLIGEVIRARGGKDFYVATKTFSRTKDGSQYDVDRSLKILGVDKIDLYQLHDVSSPNAWEQVMHEGGALEGLQTAKLRGLIDHIGFSCHSLEILEKGITCGEFDVVMLEYSAFYPETDRLIALAKDRDVGIIVMRPLGGSGRTSAIRSRMKALGQGAYLTPTMLLRYVLSNPRISVAIPGMRLPSRVDENVELALSFQPLSDSQKQQREETAGLWF